MLIFADAGGPSSVTWDATAVIVCRGGGPRGAMDRSRCQKDLGHSLSVDGRYPIGIETSSPGHNPTFVS